MQKVVVKSASITLIVLIVLCICTYAGFAIFAPQKISNFYSDMGNMPLSLKYQEKVYQKDPSQENLLAVLNKAIAAEHDQKIIEYTQTLHDKVKNQQVEVTQSYLNFVTAKYCMALYQTDRLEEALQVAFESSKDYGELNVVQRFMLNAIEKNERGLLQKLLTDLKTFKDQNQSSLTSLALQRLQTDITNLTAYLDRN